MTNLHLPLCAKWFDLIALHEKGEEYRKETKWLQSRLRNFMKEPEKRHYIIFTRGYTRQYHAVECTQIFQRAWAVSGSVWRRVVTFSNNEPQSQPLLVPEWGYERENFDYALSLAIHGRVERQL